MADFTAIGNLFDYFWFSINIFIKIYMFDQIKNLKIEKQGTIIGKAVDLALIVDNFLLRIIFLLIWFAGAGSIVIIASDITNYAQVTKQVSGSAYIILGLFVIYLIVRTYYKIKLCYPKPIGIKEAIEKAKSGESFNLYEVFSFELAKVWNRGIGKDWQKKNSKDLLLALSESKDMAFVLARIGVPKGDIQELAKIILPNKSLIDFVARALKIAETESHHQIEVGDLFVAVSEYQSELNRFIEDMGLDIKDILNIVYWQTSVIRDGIKATKKLIDPDDLHLTGGIGRDWIYGYANLLKQYSRDLTETISHKGLGLEIVGHDKEIKAMEEALTRQTGGNAILVGDAGVGKRTTVLGFAKRVLEGRAIGSLKNKHVVEIDTDAILAGAGSGGDITARLTGVLNEAVHAGNMILFVDNIQNLFSSGDAGKVNATEVLLHYLESNGVYLIGTTDTSSFNKYIGTNGALMQRITKVNIEEPTKAEMVRILEDVVPNIEYHTSSLVTYQTIKETIKSADKYILNIPNPEKSITLLDGAAASASASRGKTIIVPKDIDSYIVEKYDVPPSEIGKGEKEKLLKLEEVMHKRVIGQNEAIDAIANAMRRSRAQITDSKKPIGSFLFLGSTGVGKTETAKALAESYFGEEGRMIRFDMSEYQNKQDIYRFIGSNITGEDYPGELTSKVREKPFSLILFDEIEKAHPDILNLFLQVLDEGHLTDGNGRRVAFTNTIIIATSNAGANIIRESISSGSEYEKTRQELLNYIQEKNIYRPEFINRFTQVVIFSPLSFEEINQVARLMLDKLIKDIRKNKGVELEILPDAVSKLAKLGFDPQMGARPMARAIQDKLENMLAKKLLSGDIKKGSKITVSGGDI